MFQHYVLQYIYIVSSDVSNKYLPMPKNKGQMNTAGMGGKHCSNDGNIQDLNVNSSESGATT